MSQINLSEHLLNFMEKYPHETIGNPNLPTSIIITYSRDIPPQYALSKIYMLQQIVLSMCCKSCECKLNAEKIYEKYGFDSIYLVKAKGHTRSYPGEFINIYGADFNIGTSHHVLPYIKFKASTPDGDIRYYLAIETTNPNKAMQFYISGSESELLEMLKERFVLEIAYVITDEIKTLNWYELFGRDPYVPDDSAFGGSRGRRRLRKTKTTRSHKKNKRTGKGKSKRRYR